MLRKCTTCNLIANTKQELEAFVIQKNGKYGRKNKCKVCRNVEDTRSVEDRRKSHLKHKYNLSVEEAKCLFKQANNKCTICNNSSTKLVIDHNHDTGKVRNILCTSCNKALGLFKDSPEILELAKQYLEIHGNYNRHTL